MHPHKDGWVGRVEGRQARDSVEVLEALAVAAAWPGKAPGGESSWAIGEYDTLIVTVEAAQTVGRRGDASPGLDGSMMEGRCVPEGGPMHSR